MARSQAVKIAQTIIMINDIYFIGLMNTKDMINKYREKFPKTQIINRRRFGKNICMSSQSFAGKLVKIEWRSYRGKIERK